MSLTVQLSSGGGARPSFRTASFQSSESSPPSQPRLVVSTARKNTGGRVVVTRHTNGSSPPPRVVVPPPRVVRPATAAPPVLVRGGGSAVDALRVLVVQAATNGDEGQPGRAAAAKPRTQAAKRRSADVTTFTRTIDNTPESADADVDMTSSTPAKRARGTSDKFAVFAASAGPLQFATAPTQSASFAASPANPPPAASRVLSPLARSSAVPGPSTTVLVRNLASGVDPRFLLTHLFGSFDVASLTVDTDPLTHACNGTAEVVFARESDARDAIAQCQGQQLLGKQVRLSIIAQKEATETKEQVEERQRQNDRQSAPQQPQAMPARATNTAAAFFNLEPAGSTAAPASAVAPALPSSFHPSPFSAPPSNVGFVWGGDESNSSVDGGAETVFNITNLKMQNQPSAPTRKPLQVRPKSVVISNIVGEASTGAKRLNVVTKAAAAAAATNGKPAITINKRR